MEETNNQNIEALHARIKQQEKLAQLGLLSAGIAHEIQNPLNFVINFSKMSEKLLSDLEDIVADNQDKLSADDHEELTDIMTDLKENMQRIAEHGERAIDIVRGILLISRGKDGERLPTDMKRLVHEYVWLAFHAMRANHKDFNVAIRESYQENLKPVMVIPQDISRAVLNTMNNACYAVWHKAQSTTDFEAVINISITSTEQELTISFQDNGEGMNNEVKERLFENFFTTKPVGQGTGLGMGITRDIIENRHGGHISIESHEGEGTTITFTIPIGK